MNNDEIDKMLYDYFRNLDNEIPLKIRNTIQNFPKEKIHRNRKKKDENFYKTVRIQVKTTKFINEKNILFLFIFRINEDILT